MEIKKFQRDLRTEIIAELYKAGKRGIKDSSLFQRLNISKKDKVRYKNTIDELFSSNDIIRIKSDYVLKGLKNCFTGVVTKVAKSHGFVRNDETNEEAFVRGRDLIGAVPGDIVLAKVTELKDENNRSDTAKILIITKKSDNLLIGTVVEDENKRLALLPESFVCQPIKIVKYNGNEVKAGDKVGFSIHTRSLHHSDHTADIQSVYGDSEVAKTCVDAYVDEKNIRAEFPEEVTNEADFLSSVGICAEEKDGRFDLRDLPIFTIDGADTKDIDDAISITKDQNGYKLGVHIADVSHYVKKGTPLDDEAFSRGTSIYIADRVIPMLPRALSNGICSLNPNEERLAFSCLMDVAPSGEIKQYKFEKTLIRSRVKGVYSEVNKILDNTADSAINEKYREVLECIPLMNELAAVLKKNRKDRGAPEIDSPESKIICDENGLCIDIKKRVSGISEGIIEEFMLMANNCAAKLAMEKNFPFVYRIHEAPTAEKLLNLQETLTELGIDNLGINESSKASDLARVLNATKDNEKYMVINSIVLRTMMKAKYSEEPLGHYGLVMKEYSHFTSPIRRYSDLSIHRILTDYLSTGSTEKVTKRYSKFAKEASMQASNTELVAVSAERDCDKFYMAEYMKKHIGEEFEGYISGVIASGFFVCLPNTVEGRVGIDMLPEGDYEVKNNISLINTSNNTAYTIGDKVKVKCVGAAVSAGQVDFQPVE